MNGKTITGRYEVCNQTENTTENSLKNYPKVLTDFYNSMFELTAKTKQTYVYQIQRMLKAFAESNGISDLRKIKVTQINNKYLNAYFTHRRRDLVNGKPVSNDIIAVQITAIRNFFEYCVEQEIIPENPMKGIKRPSIQKYNKHITYLEYDEIEKVLENVKNGVGSHRAKKYQEKWKNRNLCLIAIPLFTGIRVGSLVEINMQNIDLENQTLHILQKGGKELNIYLPETLIEYIENWIKDRDKILKEAEEEVNAFLITQYNGRCKRMSEKSANVIVKKYSAGINKHITPHKLRHTFATHTYQETGDIYLLSNLLGHANIQTTTIYAAQDKQKAKDVMELIGKKIGKPKE